MRAWRRMIAAFLLGALAVLFAVLNLDEVEVNWILATGETPLILVIVVSAPRRGNAAATGSAGF